MSAGPGPRSVVSLREITADTVREIPGLERWMRAASLVVAAGIGGTAPGFATESRAADSSAADRRALVERFVGLFDRHALDSLLVMVHDEIEWYGIEGGTIRSQTRGRTALARDLADYFEGCPTCHSTVAVGQVNGRFVSAVETATWDHAGRRFVQKSSCVYEIENGLVRRVWYFPSVRP